MISRTVAKITLRNGVVAVLGDAQCVTYLSSVQYAEPLMVIKLG